MIGKVVKGIHFPLEGGVIAKESNKVRRRGEGLLSPGVWGGHSLATSVFRSLESQTDHFMVVQNPSTLPDETRATTKTMNSKPKTGVLSSTVAHIIIVTAVF